jgi:hypothetical protein
LLHRFAKADRRYPVRVRFPGPLFIIRMVKCSCWCIYYI